MNKYPYTTLNITSKIPYSAKGVYAFWFKNRCVYVGKAKRQPLRKRLIDHFKGSHNTSLTVWIEAYERDLSFCVFTCKENHIDFLERKAIKRWQPATNILLK